MGIAVGYHFFTVPLPWSCPVAVMLILVLVLAGLVLDKSYSLI